MSGQDHQPRAEEGATTSFLRRMIDSGRTGDKVRHHDPAAAPLGTDDEAAGSPPSPERVRTAMRQELHAAGQRDGVFAGGAGAPVFFAITILAIAALFAAMLFLLK